MTSPTVVKDESNSQNDVPSSHKHSRTEDQSSSSGSSGSNGSRMFSAAESRQVKKIRALVYFVLFLAGAAVATVVYITTIAGENHTFESTFNGLCEQLHYVIYEIAHEKVGSIGAIRTALISTAIDNLQNDAVIYNDANETSSSSWPFVTLSSFEERANAAKTVGGGIRLTFHPVIEDSNRIKWERYVATATKKMM
jgi:hypothetical protein